jgi:DNA-binding transcriptional ArsR family regulator
VENVNDVRVVKAIAHPIRVAALTLLEDRVLSPKELAEEIGAPLPLVSYHVRQLEHFGLIELVRTTPRRGTLQHFYRAKPHPTITDLAWSQAPMIVKREMVSAALTQANAAMAAAAAEGGFDRADAHASRTTFQLDERGWSELSKLLAKTLERFDKLRADSEKRITETHDEDAKRATVLMMLFEGPYAPLAQQTNHRAARGRRRRPTGSA